MSIKHIGKRGTIITNKYGDSVYLINADKKLYLCDTGEGPVHMNLVKDYIKEQDLVNKELIIFNSHSDWDHIWGNSLFESTIISHDLCRDRMIKRAEHDVDVLKDFHNDDIKIKLPDITFSNRLSFSDDYVEFIHLPGHTEGSSICYDKLDSIIYVGDLLEDPIPILNSTNILEYIESLEKIKKMNVNHIVSTHSGLVNFEVIERNLTYLKEVYNDSIITNNDVAIENIHTVNQKNLLLLKCDEQVEKLCGNDFDFKKYKKDLWDFISTKFNLTDELYWDIRKIKYDDLKEILVEFLMDVK